MTSFDLGLPETVTTQRLVLTTPAPRHIPAMAMLANDAAVHANLARLPFPYEESDAQFFIANIARTPDEWAWCIEKDGAFIGTVGLHCKAGKLPEIGYWLGQPYWGQGYATETARAVVEAARSTGRTPGLRSRSLKSNTASQNVLVKSGFRIIGEGLEEDGNLVGKSMVLLQLDLE